jgi:TPR repeat protein
VECFVDGRYDNGPANDASCGEAFAWIYWSSWFSDYTSKYLLGRMSEDGHGTAKDETKASECYRAAAYQIPDAGRRLRWVICAGLFRNCPNMGSLEGLRSF